MRVPLAIVVGHGPSPAGRGWGERIDSAEIVIRMSNCSWQDPVDYGERYDYGLLGLLNKHGKLIEREPDPRQPDEAWVTYDWMRALAPKEWRGVPCLPSCADTLVKMVGGRREPDFRLTKGCAAACWTIVHIAPVSLALIGCDMLLDGRPTQPINPPQYPWSRSARRRYHDHAAETKLIRRLALAFDVGIEDWR